MALNIAELIIFGILADFIFRKLKMPGLIGMLLLGVVIGPYTLNLLKPSMLQVSSDLRMMALIVILLRAGFELSKDTLNRVGVRALLLSFIPAVLEGAAVAFLGDGATSQPDFHAAMNFAAVFRLPCVRFVPSNGHYRNH